MGFAPGGHPAQFASYGAPGGKQLYDGCATGCRCPLCRHRSMWFSVEAMSVWGKGRFVPPLVTTSPAATPLAQAGVLGQPNTNILFGNGDVGNKMGAGLRIDFGMWMDEAETLGLGAKVFGVRGDSTSFGQSSTGVPILARPFFNANTGLDSSQVIAYPGVTEGSIGVRTTSDILGTDAYLRTNAICGQGYTVDLLGGYMFNRIDDDVTITSFNRVTGGGLPFPVGSTIDVVDFFDAHNEFHGGMVAAQADVYYQNWRLTVLGKLGIGNMNQRVNISGRTVADTGGGPVVTNNGLLTQPSNIGSYSTSRLVWVPEFGATLGYTLDDCLEITLGYYFMWWSSVVQSGEHIGLTVDPTQGIPAPVFQLRETDYWIHGFTLGGAFYW